MHEYHPSFPCNQAAGVGNKRLYGRLRPSLGLYGPPWAVMGLCGPLCASLGIFGPLFASLPGPIWASMAPILGFSGPLLASLAFSGQSPKQPTHTHNKHTETFHKLPTTRLHPERETIKKQTQTMKQATETFHNLLVPRSPCPSLAFFGPPWASLGLSSLLWPISQATDTHP